MSAPTATLSPAPTDARRAPAGRQRIVVADDHPVFREGMVRALVETGRYEIAGEAPDGNAALDLIRRQRPDVARRPAHARARRPRPRQTPQR
jgi:hypothetical protein